MLIVIFSSSTQIYFYLNGKLISLKDENQYNYIVDAYIFGSCKKESIPRLDYLNDSYTFEYTYKELKHGYNVDTGGNEIVESNGSGSKDIAVVPSPYSEKSLLSSTC